MGNTDESDSVNWADAILSTLNGAASEGDDQAKTGALPVKRLRKMVLLSLQMDETDKKAKKHFKRTIQAMETDGSLSLSEAGMVTLKRKKRKAKDERKKKKKSKTEEKSKKKRKTMASEANDDVKESGAQDPQHSNNVEDESRNNEGSTALGSQAGDVKNKPCKGNPQGVTRLFLGNLPFAVDEKSLGEFLPGNVTHIKWITDKDTGKFYGSAFCEMDTTVHAAEAVAKAGSELMGRPIKINFAPARPGDIWPPEKKVISGGGGRAGGTGVKAMSEKPENCQKLFIGNLSYDIDDDAITKFFAIVDAELKAVRWLHHKDSGDFKGCGYAEFWNAEACEKAATLNGKNLLGRPIRIDWTD